MLTTMFSKTIRVLGAFAILGPLVVLPILPSSMLWHTTAAAEETNTQAFPQKPAEAVPGELLIQLTGESLHGNAYRADLGPTGRSGLPDLDSRLSVIGASEIRPLFEPGSDPAGDSEFGLDRILLVKYTSALDPQEAVGRLSVSPDLSFAEPNWIGHIDYTPNDPTYPSQWAHDNTGQAVAYGGGNVGAPDCDTDTDWAWDLGGGAGWLVLAVLDSGVDTGHPEFSGRVVAGYDFVNQDSDPADDHGHGTCCAGIALAAGNNSQGIAGVAWNVKLMPVKISNSAGSITTTNASSGIRWAADHGAKILSCSWHLPHSTTLQSATNYAYSAPRNCAIFCASGNDNRNSLNYPAAYGTTIAVGALSPCNERKNPSSCDAETGWGSNYGSGLSFLAPGVRIHTTDIRGSGGYTSGDYMTDFGGTSAATPHAAGIGALVKSRNPTLTNDQLRRILENNSDDIGATGYDLETGYGRMNAHRAVQWAGTPTSVTLFSENFETSLVPGTYWTASDANASNGYDYWGDQSTSSGARAHGGSWSAYCADYSNVSGQAYDNYMNAEMTMVNTLNVAAYASVTLTFWTWYNTCDTNDYVALQRWNGSSWSQVTKFYGTSSGWAQKTCGFTGFSTLRFRWLYYSNSSGTSEGAYIDDIVITAVPITFAPEDPAAELLNVLTCEGPKALDAPELAQPVLLAGPNPFKLQTEFSFTLERSMPVRLEVFGIDGRRVAVVQNGQLNGGRHSLRWAGIGETGRHVSAGTYYARLTLDGETVATRKLVMIR